MNNNFFTQFAIFITNFSLGVLRGIGSQFRWMGTLYHHIETAILGVVVDISLAMLALRYLFVLLAVGGVLAYFQWWIGLGIYGLVLGIAIIGFVRSGQNGGGADPDAEREHQETRNKSINFMRLPMRVLAMLVTFLVSWYFVDWNSLSLKELNFEMVRAEQADKVMETASDLTDKATHSVSSSNDSKPEEKKTKKTEEKYEKVATKKCLVGWNNQDFKEGWCSLGTFSAGDYELKFQSSLKMVSLDKQELPIPIDGVSIHRWDNDPNGASIIKIFENYSPIPTSMAGAIISKKTRNRRGWACTRK
jgi:hypothetical protein